MLFLRKALILNSSANSVRETRKYNWGAKLLLAGTLVVSTLFPITNIRANETRKGKDAYGREYIETIDGSGRVINKQTKSKDGYGNEVVETQGPHGETTTSTTPSVTVQSPAARTQSSPTSPSYQEIHEKDMRLIAKEEQAKQDQERRQQEQRTEDLAKQQHALDEARRQIEAGIAEEARQEQETESLRQQGHAVISPLPTSEASKPAHTREWSHEDLKLYFARKAREEKDTELEAKILELARETAPHIAVELVRDSIKEHYNVDIDGVLAVAAGDHASEFLKAQWEDIRQQVLARQNARANSTNSNGSNINNLGVGDKPSSDQNSTSNDSRSPEGHEAPNRPDNPAPRSNAPNNNGYGYYGRIEFHMTDKQREAARNAAAKGADKGKNSGKDGNNGSGQSHESTSPDVHDRGR